MPESPYPMIPVAEAIEIIMRETPVLPPASMPFDRALGLVLAEEVRATAPMPPFPAAAVDGFAVVAGDTNPIRRIVGEQMAGHVAGVQVTPGSAARVTTGAPIPPGADAMVMVEFTEERDGEVEIRTTVEPGSGIRPAGTDIEAGQLVLAQGTVLGPAEIGLLATVERWQVQVHPRPRVAVMSTGDEIREPGQDLQPGQIRDSNRYTLMSVVRQMGMEPLDLGIVHDQVAMLAETIERGLAEAEVLVTSGGVSMGQRDLVKPYLAEKGTLHFGRVNTKPGKPVTFATMDGGARKRLVFALPGFPVSALVSFENFVRPALLKMAGHTRLGRPRRRVRLAEDVRHSAERTEFQRVIITRQADGSLLASTTGAQGSGRLLSLHGANGLIVLPHGRGDFPAGSEVEALLLDFPHEGGFEAGV
ncbi:MAG: gephyrin-like molybdotransferase Glp [Anaerolineae bacterium]